MIPERPAAVRRFALLCSDAELSRAVMFALERRTYLPRLILLPEYEPARPRRGTAEPIHAAAPRREFPGWAEDVEIAYAPPAMQRQGADLIRQRSIEFILVACWPYLIAEALRRAASCAALNLHPSLLPAYRGPDPLGAQLACGDFNFGVTLHQLNQHFDRGDIIAQQALGDVGSTPVRRQLERQCAELGVDLFIDALARYPDWQRRAQSNQAFDTV